ncbi:hypothetical protein [Streptomyces sp. NRRL S-1813]|uniref:hypothetical protein n=1 Tax=Streptomyces sp. NRRL S-1813 TaxID=1463888 RepID=UPI00131E40EA|nr:hypothetical protein [Streptomyces sp. NRRL S-1813]
MGEELRQVGLVADSERDDNSVSAGRLAMALPGAGERDQRYRGEKGKAQQHDGR